MTTPSAIESYQAIVERLADLHPERVARHVDEMTAGRVQAWSAKPAPARSSNSAMPVGDRYDQWVGTRASRYRARLDQARRALDLAHAAETELLAAMTLEEAQALVESETASPACAVCGVVVRSPERLYAGRCQADYQYRRRHGEDTPRSIWEARVSSGG